MEQSWPSILLLIRCWLTPAVLFLLLNFIIGAIALTSKNLLAPRRHDDPTASEGYVISRSASTALHRLRSLRLTRLRSGDIFYDPTISAEAHQISDEKNNASQKSEVVGKEDEQLFFRSQSETLPPPAEEVESPAMMMKLACEPLVRGSLQKNRAVKKRAVKKKAVEEEVARGVDAQADEFINRFRQQLHIQRQNSISNYKEMLERGK